MSSEEKWRGDLQIFPQYADKGIENEPKEKDCNLGNLKSRTGKTDKRLIKETA